MSTGLSAIQQIEFNSQVKMAYQAMGGLRQHVRTAMGVVGLTERFRLSGRGQATPRVPQTDVIPMGTQYSEATATLTDWNAAEYTDVFDQAKTSVQERAVVAANIAGAITRREDQLIINALDAANAPATILNGGTGLTYAKLLRASSLLDGRAVPMGQRKLVISARGKEDLLSDTKFISRDFVSAHYIETGRLPPILGFEIEIIDNRDEGGLPIAATIRTNFAFDKMAMGLAVGIERPTAVDWIPEKTSWLANRLLSAGAVAIDALGIIELETVEA
jgi:hypothetical protein